MKKISDDAMDFFPFRESLSMQKGREWLFPMVSERKTRLKFTQAIWEYELFAPSQRGILLAKNEC